MLFISIVVRLNKKKQNCEIEKKTSISIGSNDVEVFNQEIFLLIAKRKKELSRLRQITGEKTNR